jgi:hypothetical protein
MEKFTESSKLNKIVGTDIYFNETFIIEQSKFNFNNCKYLSISSELFRNCIEIKFISVSRDKIEINLFKNKELVREYKSTFFSLNNEELIEDILDLSEIKNVIITEFPIIFIEVIKLLVEECVSKAYGRYGNAVLDFKESSADVILLLKKKYKYSIIIRFI